MSMLARSLDLEWQIPRIQEASSHFLTSSATTSVKRLVCSRSVLGPPDDCWRRVISLQPDNKPMSLVL